MKKDFEVNFENKDLEKEIEDLRIINLINKNIDILFLHKIPNIEKKLKRKEIKDQVKAVLTEDLGFDRDYIRNLCNELVEQAVKTQFEILITNGFIKRIVIAELDKLIKDNKWNGNSISSLVLQAAKQEVSEFVKNNLKFGPSVTDDTNN